MRAHHDFRQSIESWKRSAAIVVKNRQRIIVPWLQESEGWIFGVRNAAKDRYLLFDTQKSCGDRTLYEFCARSFRIEVERLDYQECVRSGAHGSFVTAARCESKVSRCRVLKQVWALMLTVASVTFLLLWQHHLHPCASSSHRSSCLIPHLPDKRGGRCCTLTH